MNNDREWIEKLADCENYGVVSAGGWVARSLDGAVTHDAKAADMAFAKADACAKASDAAWAKAEAKGKAATKAADEADAVAKQSDSRT